LIEKNYQKITKDVLEVLIEIVYNHSKEVV